MNVLGSFQECFLNVRRSSVKLQAIKMAALLNEDQILQNEKELADFACGEITSISPVLMEILQEMKLTGVPSYSWDHLKAVLVAKLKSCLNEMHARDKYTSTSGETFEEKRNTLAEVLQTFEGPPFTLQRLTEVLLEPHKTYKSLNKLVNAIEKLLCVSSTIQVVDARVRLHGGDKVPLSSSSSSSEDQPTPMEVEGENVSSVVPAPAPVSTSPSTSSPAVTISTSHLEEEQMGEEVVTKAPWKTDE